MINETSAVWPPQYDLRISKRSKQIRLQISPKLGLQVIVPKQTDKNVALDFLNSKRRWVEKHLAQLPGIAQPKLLPKVICFPAINRQWRVVYEKIALKNKIRVIVKADEIVLYGDTANEALCQKCLVLFARKQATKFLISWLTELSERCQLPFAEVSVRQQQSRWGSCSAQKNISLNYRLMFLAPELVEYVLVHELAHTVHLNHSIRFWRLVKKFISDCETKRQDLRQAEKDIPWWA